MRQKIAQKTTDKIKVSYLLFPEEARKVRLEAAERGVWPSTIIQERIAAPAPNPPASRRRNAG